MRVQQHLLRAALYAMALLMLLAVPAGLGFWIASAGGPEPPGPGTTTDLAEGVEAVEAPTQLETIGDRDGVARLAFIDAAGEQFAIDNGETVPIGDGLRLTVLLDPFPADQFDVGVAFELDRDGEPLPRATFETTWDMTFMRHGPFTTTLEESGAGVYGAEYEFFMFGQWQLDTVLTTQDNRREFAVSVYVWPN